ncbi:MAG: alanine racemase [bacterium]|nr:alanine racemase [bacterium]
MYNQSEDLKSTKPKQFWEKPTIVKHIVGLTNKFGRHPSTLPYNSIDGIAVSDLVEEFGSPLYVVSESTLRRRYRMFMQAFAPRYPRVQLAYSYKTNYLDAVCLTLHTEGAWAEVVSDTEYEMAIRNGVPGNQIVFNGPQKSEKGLERAIQDGAMINLDSFDDFYLMERVAERLGKKAEVGIRVSFQLNYPPWSRFGFQYETGDAYAIAKRIYESPFLELVGLHCHIGTYVDDPNMYASEATKIVELATLLKNEFGIKLKYWDLGGGFASKNTLHTAWLPGEQTCPDFNTYAEAICPILLEGPYQGEEFPLLLFEHGRAMVDEAMHLIVTIISQRRLNGEKKAIVVDAGINLLSNVYWYKYDMRLARDAGTLTEGTTILGNLCMNIDVISHDTALPSMKTGEHLVIRNIGAYNFTQSTQFIHTRPAVVLIDEQGKAHVVREPETVEYWKQLDRVPEHLKLNKM